MFMDKRVELAQAFILHSRPYRETSFIVEVFGRKYGRFSAVVKGGRRKYSRTKGLLQPFTPVLISWMGANELKTITQVDLYKPPIVLKGDALYSGLYLNELLVKMLYKFDVHEEIFDQYEICLESIAENGDIEKLLRQFELFLLINLGFGFSCNVEMTNNNPIKPDKWYQFHADQGFLVLPSKPSDELKSFCFIGNDLLSIDCGDYSDKRVKRSAKRLMRLALSPHLGNEPLKSRQIFKKKSGMG